MSEWLKWERADCGVFIAKFVMSASKELLDSNEQDGNHEQLDRPNTPPRPDPVCGNGRHRALAILPDQLIQTPSQHSTAR